jgi:hypothetical protein
MRELQYMDTVLRLSMGLMQFADIDIGNRGEHGLPKGRGKGYMTILENILSPQLLEAVPLVISMQRE